MSKNIKLTISLLVSNSIDTIEKCMESLVPILQNVPSELIVVDTGGTDGAIEIAKKYASKVIAFPWCNDFAKARNAGLFAAKGEWFLFLDDDEWFEDPGPIIDFFNSGEYRKYHSATYRVRNYSNKQGTLWQDAAISRMVKREKQTEFISPIHEMLFPIRLPRKKLDCFVHHFGYAFDSEEELREHANRNITLLKEVLKRNPKEYRLILQLVQEYCMLKEFEMAEKISLNAIHSLQKSKDHTNYNVRAMGWILDNMVNIKMLHKEYEAALICAREFISYDWINELTKSNLSYRMIQICYETKEYEECLKMIGLYETAYESLSADDEYRDSQGILNMEDTIQEAVLSQVYAKGICAACKMENKKTAEVYFDKLLRLQSYLREESELEIIFRFLLEERDEEKAVRIVEHLTKKSGTIRNISKLMDSRNFNAAEKAKICCMMADASNGSVLFLPYHIYARHLKGNTEEIKQQLEFYIRHQKNILQVMEPLLPLFIQYKANPIDAVEETELEEWMQQQNDFVRKASEKKIEAWIEIMECFGVTGFNSHMLYMRCLEKRMCSPVIQDMEYKNLYEMLQNYIAAVKTVYQNIYSEAAFHNEYRVFLPKNCRFAVRIEEVLQQKKSNVEIVRSMKEASQVYPKMADFCKCFVVKLQETEKMAAESEKQEFAMLGEKIKETIRCFIRQGEYEAAKQTLMQLKQLVPMDEELEKIEGLLLAGESQSEL